MTCIYCASQHWDWFEELYTSQERGYYFPDGREDDDSYDDADDEYDRFHSTRHGAGRQHSHIQSSVGRGRRVQQATQQVDFPEFNYIV